MNIYRKMIDLVGYDSFYKGRIYPLYYIKYVETFKVDKMYQHIYKVKSERTRNYYDVEIYNNGEKIYKCHCNCIQYKNTGTCKHIAATLVHHIDEIIDYEIIDEKEASKYILSQYFKENRNFIREKLNLEIEFSFEYRYIYFKLYIGNTKKYVLSNKTKYNNFLYAYENEEIFVFGKALEYNPASYYFEKCDEELLDFLIEYNDDKTKYYYSGDVFSMSDRDFYNCLRVIGQNRLIIKNYGRINEIKYGIPTKYEIKLDENSNYKLTIQDFDNYSILKDKYILYNSDMYILSKEESQYIKLLTNNRIKELTFRKEDINLFNKGLFNKIKGNITIDDNITEIELPVKPSVKLYFDIYYSNLKCTVIFDYNGKEVEYFSKSEIIRDNDCENEVITELYNYGFYEKDKSLIMDEGDVMYNFIDEILVTLSDKYEVFTSKKIDNTNILKQVSTNSNFIIGKDGILSYKFNVDNINPEELNSIFAALKSKKKYYKLKNNNIVSLSENEELQNLSNLIDDLELSKNDISSGEVIVPKYRALYIDSLKNNKYRSIKTNSIFNEFISNFKKYKNMEITFDKKEEELLRDYQKEGVKWLTTIYKCDFGAILADEMGLGKSLQTIIFIKQILKEKKDAKIIIVVPTSLVYNWEKEFKKFAPELKYITVVDTKMKRKEIFNNKDKYNIFITSYGLIRNDNDEYENMDFELAVVDEAQNIKNYQAIMTKEIKKIKAKCKIALTGTPVENNVTELWSIFDYIMPGYLNTVLKFKEKYNIKDVDEEGVKILKNLNYQISPFILRRKKKDVIKSLPEKIEHNVYIDLPEKQKMLYLKVLNDTKREMDELIRSGGFQKSRMKILQLLTKLRQICIDPSVMYDNYNGERVKIEELLSIVKENIENGHKILVFSSFKRVLENVKKIFNKNRISSYMIDGSVKSKDRMSMVELFNNDNTNCFLITLKSGGTGLNLVGADTVIHLDIWWNPQVEQQATDRAHRIGQTKTVNVIKLVTKGTIEERIIELQEKKKILSDKLLDGKSETENLSSLTEKDIRSLLSSSD